MERLNKARHVNLFFTFVNYGCRKFNNIGPVSKWLSIEKIYILGFYLIVAYYTIKLITAVKKLPLPMP
jgi:hypothetical protein